MIFWSRRLRDRAAPRPMALAVVRCARAGRARSLSRPALINYVCAAHPPARAPRPDATERNRKGRLELGRCPE